MEAIKIKKVSFAYSHKNEVKQLNDVSLNLKLGKFHMVIGPNGSGKSTLVKTIVGINRKYTGEISISKGKEEKNLKSYKNKDFAKIVSYIPQHIEIPSGIKVKEFVSYGRQPHLGVLGLLAPSDEEIVDRAIQETGIENIKNEFLDELSGGQRQKAIIAMALAQDTDIIILDEPTNNLDINNQFETLELMHQLHLKGKTIVMIMHDINQAIQYADNIIVINSGEVVAEGGPNKVITKEMLADVFNVNAKISGAENKRFITEVSVIKKET